MRLPLPESLKRQLRPLPQWSAIALRDPQDTIAVAWRSGHQRVDVTHRNVIAALRPLTIAIGSTPAAEVNRPASAASGLDFVDRLTGAILGSLELGTARPVDAPGVMLNLFEVTGGDDHCLGWVRRAIDTRLRQMRGRRRSDPYNFTLAPDALRQLLVFYICPRPVVLVSVEDGQHSNIFPMDLIGPVGPHFFTLALRTTSQSVATMSSARRMAISSLPASDRETAYRLGAHHGQTKVDWSALPFRVVRSTTFGLPVPHIAPRIRELEAVHVETIGSHTLFVTRVVSDTGTTDVPLLHHTGGWHQHLRTTRGHAFRAAG
jgi:flavin reductase (DIM6/NTAB) family NADH-FMN oxidoreductase RutF